MCWIDKIILIRFFSLSNQEKVGTSARPPDEAIKVNVWMNVYLFFLKNNVFHNKLKKQK